MFFFFFDEGGELHDSSDILLNNLYDMGSNVVTQILIAVDLNIFCMSRSNKRYANLPCYDFMKHVHCSISTATRDTKCT